MVKVMGLIFLLFDVASAQEVPFTIYHCTYSGMVKDLPYHCLGSGQTSQTYHCPALYPIHLCLQQKCQFCDRRVMASIHNGIICNFRSGYFDYRGSCRFVLLHNRLASLILADPGVVLINQKLQVPSWMGRLINKRHPREKGKASWVLHYLDNWYNWGSSAIALMWYVWVQQS